jgi:hypothetical protein
MYYKALHKEHLKKGGKIKKRNSFIQDHNNNHRQVVESAKLMAEMKSLYGKCLKNAKRILKAKPGSAYSKFLKKAQTDQGCEKLSTVLKTKINNEIRMEAKTAKRVKQGKFARGIRAAITKYQKSDKYNQYKAAIPWPRRTPAGKLAGCRKGRARLQELKKKGSARTLDETTHMVQLFKLYKERKCPGIINNAKTAAAKPPTSLF